MRILPLLLACTGTPSDTDSQPPADDSQAPSDTDWPYDGIEGFETFEYAYWKENEGERDCSLRWDLAGTPVAGCEVCAFAFAVELTLDRDTLVDDGTCSELAQDRSFVYGYAEDFEGNGPTIVREVDGHWYWWSYAQLEGEQLTWWFGWEDYYEDDPEAEPEKRNLWFTNRWEGQASLQ